ncbi:uroporphyrinogen-III synthase [Rossellomorea marisflavi]|uniref:Uroporphyrinogen-III synthase n=1 Tax=Rossellomorea marisflavi TaxID=189381 RepID=A0A0M0GN42_9BACI|nr:uroporphyrinogen-III synthase [Rossellomorea marisflavi]KON91193.1 hypothetical protein AF331_01230 [Rossellomorea marisflavi]
MSGGKPLDGVKVLITRGQSGASETASRIQAEGGIPVVVPLLKFEARIDPSEKEWGGSLHTYDWILFTSKNGVHFFLEAMDRMGVSLSTLGVRCAAVGEKTANYCEKRGIPIDFIPTEYTGDAFASEFIQAINGNAKVLVPKGNLARNVISEELNRSGMTCHEWIVYETVLPEESGDILKHVLERKEADIITFTSSSTVHHFMKVVKSHSLGHFIEGVPMACIGPITKETAEQYGLHVKISPKVYTVNEMVEAIKTYIQQHD